jgi:hypothetical protein
MCWVQEAAIDSRLQLTCTSCAAAAWRRVGVPLHNWLLLLLLPQAPGTATHTYKSTPTVVTC